MIDNPNEFFLARKEAPVPVELENAPASAPKPIEPITESDMNVIRNLVGRIADTIVSHSQLQAEVETLRRNQANTQEVVDLRASYNQLRDEYNAVRSERDHLRQEAEVIKADSNRVHNEMIELKEDLNATYKNLENTRRERDEAYSEAGALRDQSRSYHQDIAELQRELIQAKTDRDNEGYRNLEILEQRDKLAARLDTIKQAVIG